MIVTYVRFAHSEGETYCLWQSGGYGHDRNNLDLLVGYAAEHDLMSVLYPIVPKIMISYVVASNNLFAYILPTPYHILRIPITGYDSILSLHVRR